jgi:hypothetical protein
LVRELVEAQKGTEQQVRELAQAQGRAEQRLDRLEATMQKLAEAQVRSEQRLDRLEATVQKLIEAQVRSEQRLDRLEATVQKLVEAQVRTEQTVAELVHGQRRMTDQLSHLRGRELERHYRDNAGAFWGRWLRPVEAVSPNVLRDTLEACLSEAEVDDIMRLDVLVRGRARCSPETPEVWLAGEVSVVVDKGDVERAQRRAALLRKAGYRAAPLVAGEALTQGATALLRDAPVVLTLDGHSEGWEAALAALA